jgi:hypothetical protein
VSGFALLWGKILDSSIWVKESKETRLVWIALLAMKDQEGKVQAALVGLAARARVTDAECRSALKVLLSPDPDDTSGVEEGRRIHEIPGGWQIVNHDLYRFSTETKREFWRLQKAEQRRVESEREQARIKEYKKRRKQAGRAGKSQGAQEAIREGFEDEKSAQ